MYILSTYKYIDTECRWVARKKLNAKLELMCFSCGATARKALDGPEWRMENVNGSPRVYGAAWDSSVLVCAGLIEVICNEWNLKSI